MSSKRINHLTNQQQFHIRLLFQRKEIDEHKYYLSEKSGYDVGVSSSATHWISSGQAERFARDFEKNQDSIYAHCTLYCGDRRCDITCKLSIDDIHELMDDR